MHLVEFVQWSAAAAVSVKHMTPGSRRLLYCLCSSAGQRPFITKLQTHTMNVNVRVYSFTQTGKNNNE